MIDEIVYLTIEDTLNLSPIKLQKIYDKDVIFDMQYTLTQDNKVFKVNIAKMKNPDKLNWIFNVKDVIDYKKTYFEIEKIHRLDSEFEDDVDEIINPPVPAPPISPIKFVDFETKLGNLDNYNYDCYVQFDLTNLTLNNIKLIKTEDLIRDHSKFTVKDFFFSVPFFKSLKNGVTNPPIDFYFVELDNGTTKTLALKVYHNNFQTAKYYDISYNPPTGQVITVTSMFTFQPLEFN